MVGAEQDSCKSAKETCHRFVNTTPKPRATKKRRGEFVGPPGVLSWVALAAMAVAVAVPVDVGMSAVGSRDQCDAGSNIVTAAMCAVQYASR